MPESREDRQTPLYSVSLSFAGEDRSLVESVARNLVDYGYMVFYDFFFQTDLIGRDLVSYLRQVYSELSEHCAVFISDNYARKRWPNLVERQAILDRATRADDDYLIPIVLDSSWLEGLPSSIGYLDARKRNASDITSLIAKKLGLPRFKDDERQVFKKLAYDEVLLGRFLIEFRDGPSSDHVRYSKVTKSMARARDLGHFLATYGICKCDDNISFDKMPVEWGRENPAAEGLDNYVFLSLTDKGRRFHAYLVQEFLRPMKSS